MQDPPPLYIPLLFLRLSLYLQLPFLFTTFFWWGKKSQIFVVQDPQTRKKYLKEFSSRMKQNSNFGLSLQSSRISKRNFDSRVDFWKWDNPAFPSCYVWSLSFTFLNIKTEVGGGKGPTPLPPKSLWTPLWGFLPRRHLTHLPTQ